MQERQKRANLLSDRHHGFPVSLRHWRASTIRAAGCIRDCNNPNFPVVPSLLSRVRNDEVVLSVEGAYWRVCLSEGGRIEEALRVERPTWLDDPIRFEGN